VNQLAEIDVRRRLRFEDARDWWFDCRLGLFVHMGPYSALGWHEQHLWRKRADRKAYEAMARQWNPSAFDPDALLDLAEAADMKYLCFTTKHHDGFCLWDTKLTDYKITNNAGGRDLVALVADACHRRNVPLCLYYSVVDWHHRAYPNEGRHHEIPPQPDHAPDWAQYVDYLRGQVRELCTAYGPIHGIWWDMNVPQHRDPSVNAMIRELQPAAVINNRGFDEGDFGTPERDYDPTAADPAKLLRRTEACQSIGIESWGWREAEDYYSDRHLQRHLARFVAGGANYLLNIGPRGDGSIPAVAWDTLGRLGGWYRAVREAFEETSAVRGLVGGGSALITRRGDTLYAILHSDPIGTRIKLKPLAARPLRVTLLNTGAPLPWTTEMLPSDHVEGRGYLCIHELPVNELANQVLVIRLDFEPGVLDQPVVEGVQPADQVLQM
jgi:alpha-L-fucosidase